MKVVLFNPNEVNDDLVLTGTFPAHLISLEQGQTFNGAIPLNGVYRIHASVENMTGFNWQDSNREVPAKGMVNKEVRSVGVWFNPNPRPGKGDNKKYFQWAVAHGIEFQQDKNGNYVLGENPVEVDQVLGTPVLVTIGLELAKNDAKNKIPWAQARKFPKIMDFAKWEGGTKISLDLLKKDPFSTDDDVAKF